MRAYSLEITEKNGRSNTSLQFDTDGCTHFVVRNFKPDAKGEFCVIGVAMEVDDVRAMIEFMEIFLHKHELQKEKEKLGA